MKYLLFFILVIQSVLAIGQDSLVNKTLQPEQMRGDLVEYIQLLSETHPGLFRYQNETEFRKTVSDIESQIASPLPFYSFYKLMAGLTAQIKCAHTSLFPKEDIMGHIRESCNMFQFFMYPIEGKLYVLFTGTSGEEIKPGLKGNLIVEAFVQRQQKIGPGKPRVRRVPLGTLPAIAFEIVADSEAP